MAIMLKSIKILMKLLFFLCLFVVLVLIENVIRDTLAVKQKFKLINNKYRVEISIEYIIMPDFLFIGTSKSIAIKNESNKDYQDCYLIIESNELPISKISKYKNNTFPAKQKIFLLSNHDYCNFFFSDINKLKIKCHQGAVSYER